MAPSPTDPPERVFAATRLQNDGCREAPGQRRQEAAGDEYTTPAKKAAANKVAGGKESLNPVR